MILGILAVTALANAQTASLSLGSGAGTPGSNVALNLALAAAGTQAAAVQWTVQYSTSEITGVSASIFGAGRSLEAVPTGRRQEHTAGANSDVRAPTRWLALRVLEPPEKAQRTDRNSPV